MGKRLLVLHGPNLNLLGEREGRAGGRLADLDATLKTRAAELGLELVVVQSNHEGVLLDTLHAERSRLEGVVVSPAGLFGSYPLRDALEAIGVPAIEVYVGELGERVSVVSDACAATLEDDGFGAYLEALERFASGDLAGEQEPDEDDEEDADEEDADEEDATEDEEAEEPVGAARTLGRRPSTEGPRKTLGRKPVVAAPSAPSGPVKTLGRKSTKSEPASEDVLSRALVRRKVGERLAGRMTPAELAAWARAWWTRMQDGGAPLEKAEKVHADMLDETLRRLTLSNVPTARMSERELVELMTRLDGNGFS